MPTFMASDLGTFKDVAATGVTDINQIGERLTSVVGNPEVQRRIDLVDTFRVDPSQTPWERISPESGQHDADRDRIPDALDHRFGFGAMEYQLGSFGAGIPWEQLSPHALGRDADTDSIPDALDNYVGFGATELEPGQLSSGVPWEQITPSAMHRDSDNDGIPDALDGYVGPGADHDAWRALGIQW
jgi:hypothetical protein